jgi:putative restriction endonuclease
VGGFEEASAGFEHALSTGDAAMRMAAFEHVRTLSQIHGHISAKHLEEGFQFQGARVPLINPRRGIFKPKQMRYLLSIKTVFPVEGRRVWYDDQREVHKQIFSAAETVDYAFMGNNPDAADNRWLRAAMEAQVPIIYFLGVAPGLYQAIAPTFVVGFDASALKARIAFGMSERATLAPKTADERRYALREVKQRLHQATFREAVIMAYGAKCALSGLPEPLLLDAAHILEDRHAQLGQPVVQNGIPLSKIHHAAFDANLIGIDPDYRIHVSEKLLTLHDGNFLQALKDLNGRSLHLPQRPQDYPDPARLDMRFERFRKAA